MILIRLFLLAVAVCLFVGSASPAQKPVEIDISRVPLEAQEECFGKAIASLRALQGKFDFFVTRLLSLGLPRQTLYSMAFCQTDMHGWVDVTAWSLYHEGHHFLGSFGDLYQKVIAGEIRSEEDTQKALLQAGAFSHYLYQAPNHRIEIPFFPGTPQMSMLHDEFKKYPFLNKTKTYLVGPNKDFYVLLDEWNAYVENLECATKLLDKTDGKLIVPNPSGGMRVFRGELDEANVVMEFSLIAARYLRFVEESRPALFRKISGERKIREFVLSLLQRAETNLRAASKHPVLSDMEKKKELEPLYLAARKDLLSFSEGSGFNVEPNR